MYFSYTKDPEAFPIKNNVVWGKKKALNPEGNCQGRFKLFSFPITLLNKKRRSSSMMEIFI